MPTFAVVIISASWRCLVRRYARILSDSDLDVLVEFEPGHTPGLAFFGMEQELSELLGRKVDLNTAQFLSPYFRDKVLAEAVVQYTEPRH